MIGKIRLTLFFFLIITVACSSGDDSSDNNDPNSGAPSNCDVVYLDANGVTIKACPDANIGDSGEVNGVTYTIVDETTLRQMVENDEDVTGVCTSRVTNTVALFYIGADSNNTVIDNEFNQDISHWDMSNVTDARAMFIACISFNQPIGDWDVSNITDMTDMFVAARSFNQDIGDWNVSSVTNMKGMFARASNFNQDISNWDVSIVTDMSGMFSNAPSYNQDISSWDVSNVIDCSQFSENTPQWTLPKPDFTNCTP